MTDFRMDKSTLGRKYRSAMATRESVLKARLEDEGISLREWRKVEADHRNRTFDGGRRPLERKRSKEELRKREEDAPGGPRLSKMLEGLIPDDRSTDPRLLAKLYGDSPPRRFR